MEAIAKTRHLKGSPRKARLVIDLIRGRNVSHALNILKFTDKRAADPIAKTLRSAIANATYLAEQQNIAIDPDDLFVKTCFVDMGAHKNRRRMRPAPQGRAYREQRHYCHITILVSSDVPEKKEADKPRKKGKKLLAKEAGAVAPAKETKKAKKEQPVAEEVETPAVETQESTATETPQVEETTTTETVETAEATETVTEQVEAQDAANEAEVADAKDASTQTTAEKNETKPADEAQLDTNEEL
ncbi:MAG: 50S ribosomal protein L22, partial [Pyrinomonadaceae bacterium]